MQQAVHYVHIMGWKWQVEYWLDDVIQRTLPIWVIDRAEGWEAMACAIVTMVITFAIISI